MKKTLITILAVAFVAFPCLVQAAEFYFGTNDLEVGAGQSFEVGVFLDTTGEVINAVEGKISIPSDYLQVQEIRDGNSFVNLWIERPHLLSGGREVFFSGIIPSGYRGDDIYLFSLILKSKGEGKALITTGNEQVLLNDGLGTATQVKTAPLQMQISEEVEITEFVAPLDTEPPETFAPEIGQDPTLFEGKWFVVFATQDKISGIDHYEIFESKRHYSERKLQTKKLAWQAAESPYVLEDQSLRSYTYIKAVDKAGNLAFASIEPLRPLPWYKNLLIWGIIVGVLVILILLLRLENFRNLISKSRKKG